MAGNDKKKLGSSSVLVQLYKNKKLCTKVDNMLDEGLTYDYIIEFCKDNDFSISKASLTNYKKKREEAIEKGVPLLQLLDKRAKDNVTYISDKQVNEFWKSPEDGSEESMSMASVTDMTKVGTIFNDLELLDEIIKKGAKGLQAFDVVDTPLAMKAIELKAKITNNQLSGLSIAGLREIKLRQTAKETAMMQVIMAYVPEDQHDKLFEDLDLAEKEFYENLDLTEEDKRISKALESAGLGI
ncbi:hypothetical protein HOBO_190 [Bacillus phage Hobo]|uniref:Uncharacterized protein n=2 Tax=Caeruleovirus BM15 TaxID=1985178 RepID=A0A0S2MUN0_9CAUD|nr:hypothetical protein FD732_gp151 [Bacillus phage BM15]ALO79598.1 hypothetical protein BM10_194 [Bacillus phage BM15]AXQ66946.1 hypothetical protein HOBO_190 [Bacillus phage Hobo]